MNEFFVGELVVFKHKTKDSNIYRISKMNANNTIEICDVTSCKKIIVDQHAIVVADDIDIMIGYRMKKGDS